MKKISISTVSGLIAMIIFWAITPVAIAFVKNEFSLMFQLWIRHIAAAALLWTIVLSNPELRKDLLVFRERPLYFLVRLLLTACLTLLFQFQYTYCFFLIAPAFGILLYQCQVLFSLILGVIFFKSERKLMGQSRTLLGMILAVCGAFLVILFRKEGVEVSLSFGILLALGAALAWAFVGVSLRKGVEGKLHPLVSVSMVFTIIVAVLTPAAFLSGEWIVGEPKAIHWFFLVGSGLLGIAGGQGIFYNLLPRFGLITLNSTQLLVPFVTGVFSFILFRESIMPFQILGGLILLGGCRIILVQRSKL